ncbi:phosphatase PAP2 family protein [Candidatus Erwinia haradaeae]|uniref:undecaprenyl-diphosphate phosphatase n=1 Tax=Candidatus Erwinia haradaeae TaxID=1922217 RepID=A0A451DA75_9GAMM|nr:phosphatase PAP2 family protein [Candidatus Erwinia haradaeae]VFP83178.1 Phosphatidylglycerophosphatase B [Candidatus Erwinia haradaeae]
MMKTLKHTTLSAFILLLIPLIVTITEWQWKPFHVDCGSKLLFLVAETITYPWVLWTTLILVSLFGWCLRCGSKSLLLLSVLMTVSLVTGQSIKILLKDHFHSVRPYYLWLQSHNLEKVTIFSNKKSLDTKEIWHEYVLSNQTFPPWLIRHWHEATQFSFPSGHTIFSATWALVGTGLLWPRRCYFTVIAVMIWAATVMSSRLAFGMHWSRDLFASVVLSWVLSIFTCWILKYIRVVFLKELQTMEKKQVI